MTSDYVAFYRAQIDPTEFKTVVDYLHGPRSPIQYLLHVREPAMLAELAAQLEGAIQASQPLEPLVLARLREGSLKISSRQPLSLPISGAQVDPAQVPARAACEVIYLPPFYLVHTPGLFEGKLHDPARAPERGLTTHDPSAVPAGKPSPQRRSRHGLHH